MTALTTEVLSLTPSERLKLIQEVWESLISDPASVPATADELRELDARRDRYTANPNSLVDWEDLKCELAKRRRHAH